MSQISTKRVSCRLCSGKNLRLVLPIKASPIADAFVGADKLLITQPLAPLDLYQCSDCGHAQNLDVVNPELLFREYIFTTSSSKGLIDHFNKYASDVVDHFKIHRGSLIVELGSNDGTLLKFFKDLGMKVLGVDPAREIANKATVSGIKTIPDYFDSGLSKKILSEYGPAKLIVANNVYAHADQLGDITKGIAQLLDDDGVFIFEVSYLLDIVDKFVFDTIYHEHLSYHSIKPFVQFFKSHGLQLFDVESIGTKGGSIRGFVQKINGGRPEKNIIQKMLSIENERGLHEIGIFSEYAHQIEERKNSLLNVIKKLRAEGKKVVGYGASTTVTTLMYHFELTDQLDYLIDDNERKHGLFSPGCHLPVVPSSVLREDPPDVVVILAWQYAKPIMEKNKDFLERGGLFIVPLPNLQVISKQNIGDI
jgi:hypothetical protein